MKMAKLRERLRADGIRPDAYDLDNRSADEAYVLMHEHNKWVVFYSERGLRSSERVFETEEEACRDLYDRIQNDPTTRGS
jgi:hypothetical protein